MPDHDINRILFLTHSAEDAAVTEKVLKEAGVACRVCRTLPELVIEARTGVGALLIPEEIIDHDQLSYLSKLLAEQPEWSDLPLLILIRPRSEGRPDPRILELQGLVYLIERPVWIASLLSAVQSALRSRRRQYEVRRLLKTLRESEEKLLEADRRKDEFLAVLAHELRNPMAAITSVAQIFGLGDRAAAHLADMSEILQRQTGHMNRLLDDLLDVSRVSRGKIDLKSDVVDITTVVAHAVQAVKPRCDKANIDMRVDAPEPGTVRVFGDLTRLVQVVGNILNNACKFTESAGQIAMTVSATPDEVVIVITDNGIGISADDLSGIFQLFAQVESTRKRSGGLGIGLALVKGLVEMHGGSVSAASAGHGHGSTFTVRLPRMAEKDTSVESLPTDRRPDPPQGFRLLLVEDNPDVARSTGQLLRELRHEVRYAATGRAAREACEAAMPDVVILDLGLPDIDGYEVARFIRQMPSGKDPIIVVVSGWAQSEDRKRSSEAGCTAHLPKPVEAHALNDLVHRLVAERRSNADVKPPR